MARKRIIWTDNKINQFIKEGKGQGEGENYIPWISVGDFSSLGRSHRIRDIRNGRIHHFFSDLEKNYYYFLLWNENITDIREQYPLFPVLETKEIADMLGVKHPQYNGIDIVMTTDILISTSDKLYARSVKPSSDIEKQRVREKIEIEKLYWRKRDIDFKVVTEKSFSIVAARNIEKLYGYYQFPFENMNIAEQQRLTNELVKDMLNNDQKSISDICLRRDTIESMPPGSNLRFFFHLVARKIIPICIDTNMLPTKKINQIVDVNALLCTEVNVSENYA